MQVAGYFFIAFFVIALSPRLALWVVSSIVFSSSLYFIDSSFMATKQLLSASFIILLYIIRSSPASVKLFNDCKANRRMLSLALIFSIVVSFSQAVFGHSELGIFGIPRISSFSFDANYYAVYLSVLLVLFSSYKGRFLFHILLFSTQGLTIIASYLLRAQKVFLVLVFASVLLIILSSFSLTDSITYLPLDSIDDSIATWLKERCISFDRRLDWARLLILNGDFLEGIAPHMSFFSGFKKNSISTVLYFFFLLVFVVPRSRLSGMFLIQSLSVDVFFGPTNFLVTLALGFL